ncbi:hypothetical protein SAMN05428987_5005 [Paenibacillus sp. CF095]|uniref:hypothetical protein n=1 Tax=Paenibacillus sp. CF095 TaxID=1881033 RepID=UPI0008846451|nr:hypothetical protein [Paenibacillus sp. CF095]SDD50036.1 hypothetical protein SAMN05428987_5005 [Paenibacillus sp. CF095]
MNIRQVVHSRAILLEQEQRLYESAITNINLEMKKLLNNDFGSQLIRNSGRDLAGELVRNFFDTSDYHITVDQMMRRILEFNYDDEYDPLAAGQDVQKLVFNYNDPDNAGTMKTIMNDLENSKQKLFEKSENAHPRYKDSGMIQKGKKQYRERRHTEGSMQDDYTEGIEASRLNSQGKRVSQLHVEHTQALSSAYVYNRYLKDKAEDRIKEFYNSSDNFTMMFETANQSKGDVRVEVSVKVKNENGVSYEKVDITHRATPHEMANAVASRWEHLQGEPKKKLQDSGYLDGNGKVSKQVKSELVKNYRKSQNEESKVLLKETDYKKVVNDAGKHTTKSLSKIVAGQVVYYAVPALIYEIRVILKNRKLKLKEVLRKLEKAGERVVRYVYSKIGSIFKNIMNQGLKKFLKSFFDILINLVKATVKRMLKLAKSLVLSLVDAARIIGDKNATPSQKADAVFNLISVTVTSFVLEMLFEYVERQFAIPEPLLLPLQIIATVLCSNLVMLVLEKADLFSVRHGLLMANIQKVFQRENELYLQELEGLTSSQQRGTELRLKEIAFEIEETKQRLQEIDPHKDSVIHELEKINRLFDMNIDFEKEWKSYLGVAY